MLACKFCSRECGKRGLKYHESRCKENPGKLPPPRKTEAFYEAMKKRRGKVTNQHTNVDWSLISFEKLGGGKRRERLFEEANHSCTQCGFNKTRDNGRSILEIDHIDGDHTNNTRENLRVLCPNCHALTPNFRNWGRNPEKSSKRFRKGNKGFNETKELENLEKEKFNKKFIETVYNLHKNKEIDFSKFGWVQVLTEKLNEKRPMTVGRWVRTLMPDFYKNECFSRTYRTQYYKEKSNTLTT